MMEMPKPCPFCGAEQTHRNLKWDTRDNCWLECLNEDCRAEGPKGPGDYDDAFDAWNHRAPVRVGREDIERVARETFVETDGAGRPTYDGMVKYIRSALRKLGIEVSDDGS